MNKYLSEKISMEHGAFFPEKQPQFLFRNLECLPKLVKECDLLVCEDRFNDSVELSSIQKVIQTTSLRLLTQEYDAYKVLEYLNNYRRSAHKLKWADKCICKMNDYKDITLLSTSLLLHIDDNDFDKIILFSDLNQPGKFCFEDLYSLVISNNFLRDLFLCCDGKQDSIPIAEVKNRLKLSKGSHLSHLERFLLFSRIAKRMATKNIIEDRAILLRIQFQTLVGCIKKVITKQNNKFTLDPILLRSPHIWHALAAILTAIRFLFNCPVESFCLDEYIKENVLTFIALKDRAFYHHRRLGVWKAYSNSLITNTTDVEEEIPSCSSLLQKLAKCLKSDQIISLQDAVDHLGGYQGNPSNLFALPNCFGLTGHDDDYFETIKYYCIIGIGMLGSHICDKTDEGIKLIVEQCGNSSCCDFPSGEYIYIYIFLGFFFSRSVSDLFGNHHDKVN